MPIERETKTRNGRFENTSVQYVVMATFNNQNKIVSARGKFTYPLDAHHKFYGILQPLTDIDSNKSFGVFVGQDSFSFSSINDDIKDLFDE